MKRPPMPHRRQIGAVLVVLVLTAAAVLYAQHVQWARVSTVIREASIALLGLAAAFHFLSLLAKGGAWFVCLRAVGRAPFWVVARATFVGSALNCLFIGSSGEAGKVVVMTRATGLRSYVILTTIALERMLNVGGFVAFACLSAAFVPLPVAVGRILVVGGPALLTAGWLVSRRRGGARAAALTRDQRTRRPRIRRVVRVYARRIATVAHQVVTWRRLAIAVPLTFLDWSCQLMSYHLVARAAHLQLPLSGSLVALLAVNLGLVIRVTPGNVGIFEFAYATAAHAHGVPMDAALAVGLLIHLTQDLPTIVAGLVVGRRFLRPGRGPRAWRASQPAASIASPRSAPPLA